MHSLKKYDPGTSFHADFSAIDVESTNFIEYAKFDVDLVLRGFDVYRKPYIKPKKTQKERRKIGRAIRKRKRLEKEFITFFTDVIGSRPLDWQVDVWILLKQNDFRSSYFWAGRGRGTGRSALQKAVEEYMRRHRIRVRRTDLDTNATYRNLEEQYNRYREYDKMDSMKYSHMILERTE